MWDKWINLQDKKPPDHEIVVTFTSSTGPLLYEYSLKLCTYNASPGSGYEWDRQATHWIRIPYPPLDHWTSLQVGEPPVNVTVITYVPNVDPPKRTYEYSLKFCRLNARPGSSHEWDHRATYWIRLPYPPI